MICFATDVISLKQQIGKYQGGMIAHYDIMATKQHQKHETDKIYAKCPS